MKFRYLENSQSLRICILSMFIFILPFCILSQNVMSTIGPAKMREGTDVLYDVIYVIPSGSKVQILSKGINGYYKVKYNNKVGYVNDLYFEDYNSPFSKTKPSTVSSSSGTKTVNNSTSWKKTTTAAKMREGTDVIYDVIYVIPSGSKVQILSKDINGYYKVKYNNKVGYVNDLYFNVVKNKPKSPMPYSSSSNSSSTTYSSNYNKWSENSIKRHLDQKDIIAIEGIYEEAGRIRAQDSRYKVGIIKVGSVLKAIYLDGADSRYYSYWNEGDTKAILSPTATSNLFKAKWHMADKSVNTNCYISFSNGFLKLVWTDDGSENVYVKLYPTASDIKKIDRVHHSSGTGFAISSKGYIATNQHVIDGASRIQVRGVKGDFSRKYEAKVVIEDRNNDLAILKIDDPNFTTLGIIPYNIKSKILDAGNSVYALGYPLRATMGDEVKLTNGIISSKTGFQGDITTYQITVPVQPGNSGGPLLNSDGTVIGIISAKHTGAENAAYAIKTNYLMNLIQSLNYPPNSPVSNSISNKNLSEQVKYIKEFVYILEVH